VLRDFHDFWTQVKVKRKLRSTAQALKFSRKTIVAITPKSALPEELKDTGVEFYFPLPDEMELAVALDKLLKTPGVTVSLNEEDRARLLRAALGLSYAQALRVFAKVIVSDGVLDESDIELVTEEKRELVRESEALEFETPKITLADVGGLEVLKRWVRQRERAFGREAREYGLPPPKGVALIGIPGTGKSMSAKMIASMWALPLVRLDVGALFGAYVGESERKARRALQLAETLAPCVLWIDEMEKALAHGGHDSGTSTRVFGSILTWMAEKTAPCFVVATANNIEALPPELLRRGRFDEIFFLDLPNEAERTAIFTVHLKKRRRKPEDFDLSQLVSASSGCVGAEIEQAVIDAMFLAFDDGREVKTADILQALHDQVPLSVSRKETIANLRAWLTEGRARSASS
jgi:SpoVK/Ycf46/Vps4 family AAA+-type ATPase